MKILSRITLLFFIVTILSAQTNVRQLYADTTYAPINPNATTSTKRLFSYLYSISGKYTLAGQHHQPSNMSTRGDSIFTLTGKYPALWGGDFGFSDERHNTDNIIYRKDLVAEIKKQFARGSVITITYHQANPVIGEPCDFNGGIISSLSDQEWNDLLTPGTEVYEKWRKQMDLLADYLKQVRDADIPVLFRPYHEMNGDWFWWGKRTGEKGFSLLWKQLYDYYTNVHQLNNLIWVWGPDKPHHGLIEYYPGDDFVDIVSCDIYPRPLISTVFEKEWYDQLLKIAKNKPLAIGENSIFPTEKEFEDQPRWIWFMPWDSMVFQNGDDRIKKVYSLERILTSDELPYFSDGQIKTDGDITVPGN